jgi:hypothetical protein
MKTTGSRGTSSWIKQISHQSIPLNSTWVNSSYLLSPRLRAGGSSAQRTSRWVSLGADTAAGFWSQNDLVKGHLCKTFPVLTLLTAIFSSPVDRKPWSRSPSSLLTMYLPSSLLLCRSPKKTIPSRSYRTSLENPKSIMMMMVMVMVTHRSRWCRVLGCVSPWDYCRLRICSNGVATWLPRYQLLSRGRVLYSLAHLIKLLFPEAERM